MRSSRRFVPACLPCGGLHVGYASRLPPRLPQNKLGGGEGVEGLYGSIKRSGMDKVGSCRLPLLTFTSLPVDAGMPVHLQLVAARGRSSWVAAGNQVGKPADLALCLAVPSPAGAGVHARKVRPGRHVGAGGRGRWPGQVRR